jgi:O-antigen/teichoic acid export membrane protein
LNTNLRNILSLFSTDIALKLIGFVASVYLARVLGKSGFGAISIAASVLTYASILTSSGLVLLGTRKVITQNERINTITGEIFYSRIILTLLVFFIILVVSFLFIDDETNTIILAYSLFLFPFAFLLEWFFIGYQKMGTLSLGRIAGMTTYLIFILLFVNSPGDAALSGIAWTLGGFVNTYLLWSVYKKLGFSVKLNRAAFKMFSLLKEAFPLGAAGLISQFYIAFPIIYLGLTASNAEVGLFSAAFKIITFFLVFDRVFNFIFFPKITALLSGSPGSLEEVFNKIFKLISIFSLFIAVIVIVASGYIITTAFGNAYVDATIILQVLTGYLFFTLLNSVFTYTFIGMCKDKVYTYSIMWGLIIFVLLTFSLTPFFGRMGVVYSFIFFDLISMTYMTAKLKKMITVKIFRPVILPFLVTFGIVLPIFYVSQPPLFWGIVILTLIYLPLITLIAGFSKSEINFLKRALT